MGQAKTKTNQKKTRSNSRVQVLLDASARLFAVKGYNETTMRDIAEEVDMLPGSIYYHFKSKHEVLLAVYTQAVSGIKDRVAQAVETEPDAWKKLTIAVTTHIETILDQNDYAQVMVRVLPHNVEGLEDELATLRNDYEKMFTDIIDELPLKKNVNRKLFRLMLLGALNSTKDWYKEGGEAPSEIGESYVSFLKEQTNNV